MELLNITQLLTVSGDGKPDNVISNEFDLNNGGWIVIGILIGIIIVLIIKDIVLHYKYDKKFSDLHDLAKNGLNEEEYNLVIKYKKLNSRDKSIINDTLSELSKDKDNNVTNK